MVNGDYLQRNDGQLGDFIQAVQEHGMITQSEQLDILTKGLANRDDIISDFQQLMGSFTSDSTNQVKTHLATLRPNEVQNIIIDSAYISKNSAQNIELTAKLVSNSKTENTPVSLFNADKLIAKTSAVFGEDNTASVVFSLPKDEAIDGSIQIADNGLGYDNTLYFNIGKKEKIKTLIISGNTASNYIKRIFTSDEFLVEENSFKSINYSVLSDKSIIILNELKNIPSALSNALKAHTKNGGNLLIIPAQGLDKSSYNLLLGNYFNTNIFAEISRERNIANITFSHPLYKGVFEKKVSNFQYPTVNSYYGITTAAPTLLGFASDIPFLIGNNGVYLFTASISKENSNFQGSPLIVPTLYNMGSNSLKLPKLYNTIGTTAKVDVSSTASDKNSILKIKNTESEFVPLQQSFSNKTRLTFTENPTKAGIYSVMDNTNEVGKISFNYKKSESALRYTPLENLQATTQDSSINNLFQDLKKDQSVNELWKWFVILALIFVLTEVLIQKFIK